MIREIEISKRFPFIDRASTCCLLRTPIGYRQDGDLFGNRRGGNGGGKLGVLCSCSVSVQVSPYLRERRCERIEVFSSISSSPPPPIYISNDFERKRVSLALWIFIGSSILFAVGEVGKAIEESASETMERGARKGVFSSGWLSRGRATSNDGSLPGKGLAATRRKKRGIVCREQRREEGSRGTRRGRAR